MTHTIAGVAALSVPSVLAGQQRDEIVEPARRLRHAVKLGMVQLQPPHDSLLDKFTLVKRLGFDGVELSSPNDLDPAEVIDARDQTGLPIHGVVCSAHWSHPLSHPDASVRAHCVQAMESALRDCKAYGGDTVLLVPAVVNKDIKYADAYERSQMEIRRLLPLCDEIDIDIAFENVWNNFLLSPMEAARYVDEFESEHIGWYFDVGNVVRYGWPEQWIETLGQRIRKLDIKEYSRQKQNDEGLWKGFNVKIGDGDCDWPAVMRAVEHINFRGWATAEVGGGGEQRLAEIKQRMDRVLRPELR